MNYTNQYDHKPRYVQEANIVLRKVGEIYLLIPICKAIENAKESFLVINKTGKSIWKSILFPVTIDAIATTLENEYDLEPEDRMLVRKDIEETIKTFIELGYCKVV